MADEAKPRWVRVSMPFSLPDRALIPLAIVAEAIGGTVAYLLCARLGVTSIVALAAAVFGGSLAAAVAIYGFYFSRWSVEP